MHLRVLSSEGKKRLGEGVEEDGEKGIFEIEYREVGCSRGYGRQKCVRVRDYWGCRRDGFIDFSQILDLQEFGPFLTARIGVLCGEWVGIKIEA